MFKALLLKQEENKKATATVEDIDVSKLPEGDVLVKINYSTINYKDSLAITSSSPIVKSFPMVPGIDFSGEVEETSNENFKIGDKVILNGFGVGEAWPTCVSVPTLTIPGIIVSLYLFLLRIHHHAFCLRVRSKVPQLEYASL